ncbi:MAG TPA: mechanosensitive ion channel, partial [Burkholderiales bacterium]|nr:mechanosensitive ion channel [Burkholderiales bacterium]
MARVASLMRVFTARVAVLLALCGLPAPAPAQTAEAPNAEAAADLSQSAIDRRIRELDARKDIDADSRAQIAEIYRSVRKDLERLDDIRAQTAQYQKVQASGRADAARLERSNASTRAVLDAPVDVVAEAALDVDDLVNVLAAAEAKRAALKATLAAREQALAQRTERIPLAKQELRDAQGAIADLNHQIDAATAERKTTLGEAKLAALRATLLLKQAQVPALTAELAAQPVLLSLAQNERDAARLDLALAESRAKALDELLAKRRVADAEATQQDAERALEAAATKHPIFQQIAEWKRRLSAERARLALDIGRMEALRDTYVARAERIEARDESLKQRLRDDNLSEALARVLNKEIGELPDAADFRFAQREREQQAVELTAKIFQLEQEEAPYQEVVNNYDLFREKLAARVGQEDAEKLAPEVWAQLQEMKGLATKINEEQKYLLQLFDATDVAEKRLLRASGDFRTFLSRVLFWVPVSRYGADWFTEAMLAVAALLSPRNWLSVLAALWTGIKSNWPRTVVVLALVGFLLVRRRAFAAGIRSLSAKVGRIPDDSVWITVQALGLTALIALPWPLLMQSVAMTLSDSITASRFAKQVGAGLAAVALPLFFVLVLRTLCAPHGVGPVHFGWRREATDAVRRSLSWLLLLALPAGFVTATMGQFATEAERSSLGRIAFVLTLTVITGVFLHLLRFDRPLMRDFIRAKPNAWFARLPWLWLMCLVLTSLFMIALAVSGYLYAAVMLFRRVGDSFWMVVSAIVVLHLVARWMVIARARLAHQGNEAQTAQAEVMIEGSAKRIKLPDIESVDAQTRQLIETLVGSGMLIGLYFIWRDSIPALGMIGDVRLWSHAALIDGETRQVPVTVGSVTLSLLVVFLMIVTVRNIGSVLEVLLQRLRLDPGAQFAIATTARYLVIGVGTISVFSLLGVSWSKLQWLVAAMGVGLGFGLQEVVANFVSGLIILFERPVRIGDTVTVGDVTGVVSRIQIRATTLTDYDRRDVVIPNKNFITERVINWTLSDPTTRLLLNVGVAYGTNPQQAQAVILAAVRSCKGVLEKPPPVVVFTTFGASSLDFEVRAYASTLEERLPLLHEVNTA